MQSTDKYSDAESTAGSGNDPEQPNFIQTCRGRDTDSSRSEAVKAATSRSEGARENRITNDP